jgi:hypothetical protein
MGNKFYDGIIFYIPQLCYKGSYMGMQAGESEVGLECDPQDEKFANQIYVFYNQIEWKVFEERCDIKLETILKEYQFGTKIINRIATN